MATPKSGNPANNNSGYTSFMQPGNSPDNYRTSYGSDSAGRNMVTAPKPGGPILKITEGGNLNFSKTPTFSGSIRDKVATTPADRGNNPNRVAGVIGKVGDYLGNVARSARDIPTAVGTVMDTPLAQDARLPMITKGRVRSGETLTNLVSQVGQAIGAVGGRKDNDRSDRYYGGRTRATAEGHVSYGSAFDEESDSRSGLAKSGPYGYPKTGVAKSGQARTPGAKEQEQVK